MASKIKWENDIKAAISRARAEKKVILLDFYNPN
jgi:hypothetical protein